MTQTLCDRCGAVLDPFGMLEVCLRPASGPRPTRYITPIGVKGVDDMNSPKDFCRQCVDEILGLANRKVTRG